MADLRLKCLGFNVGNITLGVQATEQDVYFVQSAKALFMSLDACKGLKPVSENFPHIPTAVAHVRIMEGAAHASVQLPPRPISLPFPLLEEHTTCLENWLLQHFSSATFNTTRTPLPMMEGKPHRIHLTPGAIPCTCHTPASVPKYWEKEVQAQLDEDVKCGVIEPVLSGQPTEWCACISGGCQEVRTATPHS